MESIGPRFVLCANFTLVLACERGVKAYPASRGNDLLSRVEAGLIGISDAVSCAVALSLPPPKAVRFCKMGSLPSVSGNLLSGKTRVG